MRSRTARPSDVDEFHAGELAVRFGIVCGPLADLAEALDATPEAILDALDRAGIEPLVDTAEEKGRTGDPAPVRFETSFQGGGLFPRHTLKL